MLWYEALILGVVQGLTEFLPVSSSGHLVALPYIFDWGTQPLVFDLILHLGTAVALLTYFKNDLIHIAQNLFTQIDKQKKVDASKYTYETKLGLFIILGSIPAGLIGYFFDDYIENTIRGPIAVVIMLTLGSILMFYAERVYSKREWHGELSGVKALIIGCFQALALLPGLSRSGSTIASGMILGLNREYAARFSFLMSIPVVIGAAMFKIADTANVELVQVGLVPLLIGFTSSFVVGLLAIKFMLKFLRDRSLYVFIFYRLVLAGFLVLLMLEYLG